MVQRPLKIRPPCHILPDYFLTRLSFKKFWDALWNNFAGRKADVSF